MAPDAALIFRQHHAELVRLALMLVGDRPTAEDVVQDAFAGLHARRDRLHPGGDALAYVRAAVLNRSRSVLRRRSIARRLGATRDLQLDRLVESAEHDVVLAEDRKRVLAALVALPRRRQEVLILRYYLGLSVDEIAAVLRISPGTVKSTTARGLAALASSLKGQS
ncbi:MAG TPA: sigma-70 family RNA polymerase sigma factor [Streptosporangiaceae bacterium]